MVIVFLTVVCLVSGIAGLILYLFFGVSVGFAAAIYLIGCIPVALVYYLISILVHYNQSFNCKKKCPKIYRNRFRMSRLRSQVSHFFRS